MHGTLAGIGPDPSADATEVAREAARLERLRALVVLDTAPEPIFDEIARMAAEVCGVPIALISLIDAERQWFKANVGLTGVGETPREVAFCSHAIGSRHLFEVVDATQDPRFSANPLVTGAPEIRFYAGAPLVMPAGERVGTLCVIDREIRQLDNSQRAQLTSLARMASQALLMRQQLIDKSLAVRSSFELTLQRNEARFRALIEDQSELVSLAAADGRLLYVNPAYARHFGRDAAQMIDASLFDFVADEDRAAVDSVLGDVWRSGMARTTENRMISAEGAVRWVAWTNRLQKEQFGETLLHSVGRDVTEKKNAERALRDSQAFLARTESVAGVGGWQLEIATGSILWSAQTRRIHEVAPDFVPTLETAVGFYAPEAQRTIDLAVQRSIADGTPWDLELPFVTAKGRKIWVRAQGEAEFEGGAAVRLSGAFQDITERRQLQQRLADNERFIRQVTDNLPLSMAYVDRELRYRFVNLAHCEGLNLPREEIIGRKSSDLRGALDTEIQPRFHAVLAGEPQRFEFNERTTGSPRRIECQLIPDVDESGVVHGFYSTGVDVTDRTRTENALRELTAIVENTSDFVVQADREGRITFLNLAVRTALGIAPAAPIGERNVAEFNTPATNRLFAKTIVPAVAAAGAWLGKTVVYVEHRRELPVSHMVIGHCDASGHIDRYSAVMRDISSEVAAEHALQRQTAALNSMIEAMPAVVAVVDAQMRYRFVNDAYERWFGKSRKECVGRTIAEVLGPEDFARTEPYLRRVLAGETVEFEKDYASLTGTRHLTLHYLPIWVEGRCDGFFAIAHDVTASRREASHLKDLVLHDPLTGLLNRAGFEAFLNEQIRSGRGARLGLLYIDLDRFKPINDTHGHAAGDIVLRTVATRLKAIVRPSDAVARLGGDEFAIVLVGVRERRNAEIVAEKAIAAVAGPILIVDQVVVKVSASVGVAFSADGGKWQELVARADARLYQAKQAGRGRSTVSNFMPL